MPTGVDKSTVLMISKTKLMPITPKMRNKKIFGNCSPTPLSKKGRKNNKAKTENTVVLTIGTRALDMIKPTIWFLFLNSLKIKPARKPAKEVFNKQTRIVIAGLMGINMAKVDGEKIAIRPLKKPTTAPDNGPYKIPASTMVTRERLILTGPNCK